MYKKAKSGRQISTGKKPNMNPTQTGGELMSSERFGRSCFTSSSRRVNFCPKFRLSISERGK